ncbi:hypothetical protein RUM43_003233 [Polyplax serrata]|uniref:Breast cancer type 2 susceptibility protein n=1 Tax=Polyplax serrata TaxID=468196 RepID=A0AAN8P1U0_POLSC
MENVNNKTQWDEFNETVVNIDSNGAQEKKDFKRVLQSSPLRTVNKKLNEDGTPGSSDSSYYDIPCYQINQSVRKGTTSKSEIGANELVLSPLQSPIAVVTNHHFQPPSIHSLGTITKRCKELKKSTGKCKKQPIDAFQESSKTCNIYENLCMNDQDISWVSSMASPPAEIPGSHFNTIERATFLPEDKFQNIQPRALFSPASDDNCGCSPLPMSSDSEGEAMYKTKARLSDVCATLNNLEFKSLEQESDIFDGATSPKVKSISSITETFYPTSPVFSIKPKKSMLCRKKEIIKSPVTKSALTKLTTSQFKEKQGDVSLKEINGGGILHTTSEASSDKEDEPFLDMSFTELDKVCTSLLEKKEKDNNVPGTQNLIGISESKNETDISLHMLKHTEITKKYFYPSEVNSDLHLTRMYFSSYDEIHNKNSNNHIELKDKLNRLNINQNLLKKFGSLLKQNLTGNSKNEKERSLNKLKKSISRANVNTTNEEGDHSVDAVDEEDKMLRAVEEAEKSLAAEEAQLVKMADEMESTVVPDETAEGKFFMLFNVCNKILKETIFIGSTLKAPHTSASDLVDISASQSCVGRNLSQVTKLSTWDSIEHMLNSAATDVMTENVASQGLGFLTASGLKTVISKEALGKAKRLMEQCELEVNQGYCDGDREKTEPTIVLDSEIKNPEKNESEKGINYEGAPLIVKEEKKIQELNMSQGVNPSWKPDEFSKVGFRTASGIKVAVSEMALARAKELMVKFDQDEISKHLNDTEGSLTFSTVATSTPKAILRFRKADIKQENITEVDNENDFTGEPVKDSTDYFISSGAETVLSGKGLLRSTRFSDKGEGEITRSHRETINSLIRNTPTTSFKKEESSLNTIVDDSDTGKRNDSCLSDISANGVALSKKTVKHSVTKGLASVSEIEHSFRPDPIRTSTPKPLPAFHRKVFGIEKEQIPMEIGFSTGLGKKVQVTKEALEKAKLLLASCDEGTTTRNEENTELGGKLEPLDGDRTTEGMMPKSDADALNATLGTGTDVLALSKVEDTSKNEFQIDFRTGLGQKIEVTKEALAKAKMLMKSCDEPETKYDSKKSELPMVKDKKVDINHQPFVRKAKRKFKTPERRSALGKQNDCCSTVESSSISCSRSQPRNELEVKKEISAENSSNDLKIAAEYTGGSIPPEEWDKSFTVEIIDNTTVDHVGEVVKKRKVCLDDVKAKSPGRKRTSTKRSLETDCVPNKRMKQADCACLSQTELREKRKKAREAQEKIIKEKVTVKPILGTHTKNKISQKQFSLMEAVENIHPVAPSKNEEQSFDVSDAIAYKFSGQVLYESDSLTDIIAIQLEDGFEVIPDAEDKLGVKEVERAFLAGPGIQPNLIPHGWIENHYKWIVWKLQNYEMTFPKYFGGRTLTLRNLMLQLKYRYDREIDRHERSALRKILEHDDTSAKRMVLRVCDITKVQKSEIKDYELQLTDGWYSCPARVDPPMVRLIDKGKIQVGTKLVTQGAILANCDEGISPLEVSDLSFLP